LPFQSSFDFISQTGALISQTLVFSAKPVHLSAKLWFFQPNWCTYQPNFGFFSQTGALISQTLILSAKVMHLSAKTTFYQPNLSQTKKGRPQRTAFPITLLCFLLPIEQFLLLLLPLALV
jgi:hypothetical protein